MTIVESLKKVVKAYGGEDSNANTIVEGLRDIVTAMGGSTAAGNTVAQVIEDIAAAVPGGGGGGAIIAYIEVTHVLPNGKTLHHYNYDVFLDEETSDCIECQSTGDLAFPFVSGKPTYIQLESGESNAGDYLRAGSVSTTGEIEADGEFLTIRGEGTVTINWVLG